MAYCGWVHLRRDLTPGLYNGFSDQVHIELFISAGSSSMYKVLTSWLDPFLALIWLQKHGRTQCCQPVCTERQVSNHMALGPNTMGCYRLSHLHASVCLMNINVLFSCVLVLWRMFSPTGHKSGVIRTSDWSHHSPISRRRFDRCGCRRSRYGCWGNSLRGEVTVANSSFWSEGCHYSFDSFSSFSVVCGFLQELT